MKTILTSGIKPRSSYTFAPETKWVRSKLNEITGADTTIYGFDSGGAFSDVEAIQGTTTALWNTTAGAFDCNGDNATIATHDVGEICRLDNLNGTIMFHMKYGGNTNGAVGTAYPFCYRNPFGTKGWGIRILNNSRPQFGITDIVTDSISGLAGSELTNIANEIEGITGIIYRFGGTGNITYGMYGKGSIINVLTTTVQIPNEVSGNMVISGKANDVDTIISNSAAGQLFGDIIIVRTPLDLRASALRIANDWDNNQWEENRVLAELGV